MFIGSVLASVLQLFGVMITAFIGLYTAQWKFKSEQKKANDKEEIKKAQEEIAEKMQHDHDMKILERDKKNAYAKSVQLMDGINKCLRKFIKKSVSFDSQEDDTNGAVRILVIKSENGGGIPSPGSTLYSSICHEDNRDSISDVDHWHRIVSDSDYLSLLVRIINEPYVVINTKDIESKKIKNVYQERGIKTSYIQEVFRSHKRFMYVSIGFHHQFTDQEYKNMNLIDETVREMASIFQKIEDIHERFPEMEKIMEGEEE